MSTRERSITSWSNPREDKRGPILSKVIEWDEERMRKSREEYKKRKNK